MWHIMFHITLSMSYIVVAKNLSQLNAEKLCALYIQASESRNAFVRIYDLSRKYEIKTSVMIFITYFSAHNMRRRILYIFASTALNTHRMCILI